MLAIEFFRTATKTLHGRMTDALQGLTAEQLHFRPLGRGNSLAFIIWHYVRTEDDAVNSSLRKRSSLWNAEGWDKKLGMDPKSQGTGMTSEQAGAVRIADLGEFTKYMREVFQASEAYLESTPAEEMDGMIEHSIIGKVTRGQAFGRLIISHGSAHLGEIWYVKGLQGLKGSPV